MNTKAQEIDVLVVDDEEGMRQLLEIVLKNEGLRVTAAASGEEALEIIASRSPRVFIQDLRMGGVDGMELLQRAKAAAPEMPVIVITAYSSWDSAVNAMRLGAFNYLKKPFDTNHIRTVVQRALQAAGRPGAAAGVNRLLVGNTAAMRKIYELVARIAPTDSTVLIHGESGSGKELVARSLHWSSHRAEKPFLAVNCSAFNENLLESELFGHTKGAFTGAVGNRKGLFEAAHGGSLVLDEVAELSTSKHVRLLRVLEEKTVTPLGGSAEIPVDVRIIAATHKQLDREVTAGRFREDLLYRLDVIPLKLPPLRERRDDIPLLAGHFLARYAKSMGKCVKSLSEAARRTLMNYAWPGNVRELENVIQRHVALCDGEVIDEIELAGAGRAPAGAAAEPGDAFGIPDHGMVLDDVLDEIERKYLLSALDRTNGNLTQAAKILGMSYRSIRYKVKKLNVKVLLDEK